MEQVRLALDSRKHWLDYELVAFPQHGLLSGGTLKLMNQALASGFDVVGGLGRPAWTATSNARSMPRWSWRSSTMRR